MTRLYYDTEFHERGPEYPIELVSIGMVAEDGRELYAISSEFDVRALQANPWLAENVWPSLPSFKHGTGVRCACPPLGHLDPDDPTVRPRAQIARMVKDFIVVTPDVELWAWYAAYDHVALAQLFGRMIDLPDGVPMWTNDLKQECRRLGNPQMPKQTEGEHNALADAHHVKVMAEYLDEIAKTGEHRGT